MVNLRIPVRARQGDIAWLVIFAATVVYELMADEMLSEATERYWTAHPLLTRTAIAAIAGHLAGVMPASIDVFSARNVVHRWAFTRSPLARVDRRTRKLAA